MSKKCEKCGAPIEGFWAKISKIFGVEKSLKNENLCNKCDVDDQAEVMSNQESVSEPSTQPKVDFDKTTQQASSSQTESVVEEKPEVTQNQELMEQPVNEVMNEPKSEVMQKPQDDLVEQVKPENKEQSSDGQNEDLSKQ